MDWLLIGSAGRTAESVAVCTFSLGDDAPSLRHAAIRRHKLLLFKFASCKTCSHFS